MFNQNRKAFTLLELIVVITILAILGTIAYMSFLGYSKISRDSVRISDVSNIMTSLDLFVVKGGKYPETSSGNPIFYEGLVAWNQGIIGESVIRNLKEINKIPKDPLTENEYTYSVTANKLEYQLGAILESDNSLTLNNTNQANASNTKVTAFLDGQYNGYGLEVKDGTTTYILAVPSLLTTNSISNNDLVDIITEKKLVRSGFNNVPSSYSNSILDIDGGFDYIPSDDIVAFSGNIDDIINDASTRLVMLDKLAKSYSGTIIQENSGPKQILSESIDVVIPSDTNILKSEDITEMILKRKVKKYEPDPDYNFNLSPKNYDVIVSDPKLYFSPGSVYEKNWQDNNCDYSSMNVINVSPGTDTIPFTLLTNTIYQLSPGDYITSNTINLVNCSGIIGNTEGNINLMSSVEIPSDGIIYSSSKSNIILMGFNIDGKSDGAGGQHLPNFRGLYVGANSSTISDIKSYNNGDYGIIFHLSNGSALNNIESYNNNGYGIYSKDSGNVEFVNNIHAHHNGGKGFEFNNTVVATHYKNITTNNNGGTGCVLTTYNSSGYTYSNIVSYDNTGIGIKINASDSTVSDIKTYNNGANGIVIQLREGSILNNIESYNNTGVGIYSVNSGEIEFIDNIVAHHNGDTGFEFHDAVVPSHYKNIVTYSNSGHGFKANGYNSTGYKYSDILSYDNSGIGISISADDSIIKNMKSYNNGEHGFSFYGISGTSINNIHSFNNSMEGLSIRYSSNNFLNNIILNNNNSRGLYFGGSSNNFLNNINIYNNTNSLAFVSSSTNNTYYGNLNIFGNGDSNTSGLTQGTDSYLLLGNGTLNTSGTFDNTYATVPSTTGWNYNSVGQQTGLTFDGKESYVYGTNIQKQIEPIRYNVGVADFELYGTNGIEYNSSNYVGVL